MKKIIIVLVVLLISVYSFGFNPWGSGLAKRLLAGAVGIDLNLSQHLVIDDGNKKVKIFIYGNNGRISMYASDGDSLNFYQDGDAANINTNNQFKIRVNGTTRLIISGGGEIVAYNTIRPVYTTGINLGNSSYPFISLFIDERGNAYNASANEFWVNGDTLFYSIDGIVANYWLKDGISNTH